MYLNCDLNRNENNAVAQQQSLYSIPYSAYNVNNSNLNNQPIGLYHSVPYLAYSTNLPVNSTNPTIHNQSFYQTSAQNPNLVANSNYTVMYQNAYPAAAPAPQSNAYSTAQHCLIIQPSFSQYHQLASYPQFASNNRVQANTAYENKIISSSSPSSSSSSSSSAGDGSINQQFSNMTISAAQSGSFA
jgi:hypothetical protein